MKRLSLFRCNNELKNKTEEVVKLQIKLESIQENIRLEKIINANYNDCAESDSKDMIKSPLKEHTRSEHVAEDKDQGTECGQEIDEEHNCNECCFQGTSISELRKHIKVTHMIKCKDCNFVCQNMTDFKTHKMLIHRKRICGETFDSKSNLMIHRKIDRTC